MSTMKKYTDNDIIEAVKSSISKRECIIKLGLVPAGGNYDTINRHVERLNLDISHFKGQGWNAGRKFPPKRNIEDYVSNKYYINSHRLKLRLLKEGIKEHRCEYCRRTRWIGTQITLELHHIDGNKFNNNLDNLQLLCPNCHSQTDSWRKSKIS